MTTHPKRRDLFAEIAAGDTSADLQPRAFRRAALIEPQPPDLPARFLPTEAHDPTAAFTPLPRLDTAQKLAEELARYRARYAPFLRNLAPAPESTRIVQPFVEFDWRIQTAADLANFAHVLSSVEEAVHAGAGQWQRVRIPHYGGPLGRATTLYRTTFTVTAGILARSALFVRFGGVDYRAHVFVNGVYLGSHEGFFAPFEFDCTAAVHEGENVLLVQVQNDAICMGNDSWGADGSLYEGDKLYAATGPGWDDPEIGWHHCPPGMGISQAVTLEARPPLFISDIFVRPLVERSAAEAWIEVTNTGLLRRPVAIELSLFGQNFEETVFVGQAYELSGPAGPGVNEYRLPFEIPAPRLWDLETPWLYQLQVRLLDAEGKLLDVRAAQFGMRSFRMEEDLPPGPLPLREGEHGHPPLLAGEGGQGGEVGHLYLNGRPIRLRGANTMGFEQQDVMAGDWDQLVNDILLAKICRMNFLRLTQRPVQPEVYDYCDRLGLLTQTDLPLFGVLRRNQFSEAARQAGEMERLVRNHPCNIMVTYINEPFPGGWGKLHRQLSRPELERFFVAADQAVRLANPDRVIKAVDGDYDPPGPGLPDNHCYCGWYNGHGVDLGRLHKGYWQRVKPGWCYGCGEFGAEGLDHENVMRGCYPASWLPATADEEAAWTPDRIVRAQTGRFHYMWFDTQHSVADWIAASQAHQAWVTRLMTEAFRRDPRMVSFAIHLFIDAFPSGWMKAIMDVWRQPKPAYFAYREALAPLQANLRGDRTAFFAGEQMTFEAWVCNDGVDAPAEAWLHYQLDLGGRVHFSGRAPATVPSCSSAFQGFLRLPAPAVAERTTVTLRLALVGADGRVLHDTAVDVEVFPAGSCHVPGTCEVPGTSHPCRACIVGPVESEANRLAQTLGATPIGLGDVGPGDAILVGDATQEAEAVAAAVGRGATAVYLGLPPGRHETVAGAVEVTRCGMNARHFVSRATGHPLVADFRPTDFRFWYDDRVGYVTPFLASTLTAPGWTPILMSGNGDWSSGWRPALAAAEKTYGAGRVRVCQLDLANRVAGNPVARIFAGRLLWG